MIFKSTSSSCQSLRTNISAASTELRMVESTMNSPYALCGGILKMPEALLANVHTALHIHRVSQEVQLLIFDI
ncbi:hypothetical protein A0H81_06740 [Grifola frondosa]|uniref:Uncharacterized protein n=1 Tax=Grifola frondosa TaxID=5627 RepID=A0A1C7M935_GRIFR|nr:hypothetical protein A0H81_06740 [Grifola frondosa]